MIRTKRWCDPAEADDGLRVLVCRYRPRALPKKDETWSLWRPNLGPSRELHAALYGKRGHTPLPWDEFRRRYLDEMASQAGEIAQLADRVAAGETVTLLCSSACASPATCHRSLLKALIEQQLASRPG